MASVSIQPFEEGYGAGGVSRPRKSELVLGRDEIHVWRTSLDRRTPQKDRLLHVLAPDERARAGRFIFSPDRDRYIAGRAGLRMILGHYLGLEPAAISFHYGLFGKPALEGADLSFNVSASSGQAVYALARGRRIGVDIERIHDVDGMEQIAERFFSKSENEMLRACRSTARQKTFFMLWTRKEAIVKGIGGGLTIPLHVFDVSGDHRLPRHAVGFVDHQGFESGWVVHDLRGADGFAAAVAVENPHQAFHKIRCFSLSLENDGIMAEDGP